MLNYGELNNLGKKIVRVIGYVLCGIMLALCAVLAFASAAFTAEETVGVFGVNIYIVNEDGIPTVPKGSAVMVNPCAPYEADEGKLVLYKNNEKLTLGYGNGYSVSDGVYQINVIENGKEITISESDLIGKADYCSEFLGKVIGFIKTPLGVFCIAIVPCLVLIFYDIIRAFALKRPLPEVIPQVKNKNSEQKYIDRGISVNADGKGTYSRTAAASPAAANDVLFSYTAKQNKPEKKETPIIPLTDKPINKPADKPKPEPAEKPKNAGTLRPDVSTANTGRFDKIVPLEKNPALKKDEVSLKNEPSDAFFTQSTVPQIQKNAYFRNVRNNSSENDKDEENTRTMKTASKRSTEIIAGKRVEELIGDDDDIRDKSRYNDVDEIISGFNKKV